MIIVKKRERKRQTVDISERPTCERTSPEPRGPIPGTLEDPNEGSGGHR